MPDFMPIAALAFLLGFLVRQAIPNSVWFRVTYAISRNTPRPCAKCGHWHRTRNLKSARMLWSMYKKDRVALICVSCYNIEFRPFSAVIGKSPNAAKKETETTQGDPNS